jgi:antitoxin component of MazEF toxin-antitoxin module
MDRKASDINRRKLVRLGKVSLALTLPREIVESLGWREGQNVIVKKSGQKIVIEDWPSK